MKLFQRILEAVKGVVADILDGGVPDVKHPNSLVLEYLPIKFLHIALRYVKLLDERPYLQEFTPKMIYNVWSPLFVSFEIWIEV